MDSKHRKQFDKRVFYEVTRKGTHLYEPVKSVPGAFILVLLGVYLLLGYFAYLVEDDMPRVINEADVARDNSITFSEEAAWKYLRSILGDGPRVAGTRYHLEKTRDLKALVDSLASQANLPVRTDWQIVSGTYWLTMNPPLVNVYQNTSNVIALVEGESGFHSNGTIGSTILVNCHYDSVPFAIGAGDDAIFCALMLESLNKLTRRSNKFKHNIVFLFNGAEENMLHSSHGFLSHDWAKGVINVINLDAVGINGKPIVFQATDPRLLEVYRRASSRPSGQSIGQFLFTNGVIPSDTDFRIWRDFGNFHGLDIAFIKWSHVYHTRFDHPNVLHSGVMQNAGDMLLRLIAGTADTQELTERIEPSTSVYYDYLHVFLVTYSLGAATVVDVLVALFALTSVAYYVWLVGPRWSSLQELLFAALGRLVCMGAGILVATIFTLIMVASTTQLRYLTQGWLVVPIFWLPYLVTAVCVSQAYDAWRTQKSGLNRSIRALQAMAATRLLLALSLLAMSCIPSLTTMRYFFTVPLFLMSLFAIVSLTVVRYVKLQAWQHLLMEFLFSLPSTMFMFSLTLKVCSIMLPTVGRTPTDTPDYTIAMINVGVAIFVTSIVSGIELVFSRKRIWLVVVPVAVTCVVLMFIPFAPYQDEGPATQRHHWFHSDIISYDFNNVETERVSGLLVTKHDAYTPLSVLPAFRDRGIILNSRDNFTQDCEQHVYCNLPLFRLAFGRFLKNSLFLYTGGPTPFNPDPTTRVVTRSCVGELCTLNFVMTGTAHNTLTIWPRSDVTVQSWSFSMPVTASFEQQSRPVYAIIQSTPTFAEQFTPLEFNVTFQVPLNLQSQPIVDFSHHAHKIYHPEEFTAEYQNLLNAVPRYFNIASFMSIRKNYVF